MRYLILPLALAALLLAAGGDLSRGEEAKGDAFLTKDLEGWDGLKEFWSSKEGALIGETKEGLKFNTFLCSKKKYKDFELSFQVRLKGGTGNSGVQVRSRVHDDKKFAVTGPQCDIGQQYWGSLYGENFGGMMKAAPSELVKKVVKQDDFNDYAIRCHGKHVTIKVNGETTVDGEFEKMPEEGIIAFQLHQGPPMEVTFRNIKFKELK
jgi:hypothetical protein